MVVPTDDDSQGKAHHSVLTEHRNQADGGQGTASPFQSEVVVRGERLMSMPFAAERFGTAMKIMAAILMLVIPCLPAGAAPSPILELAAHGIQDHRKGDATIRFVRKDGTAAAGLKVEAVQRTHDFAFGN
jgi:hypothetical protein